MIELQFISGYLMTGIVFSFLLDLLNTYLNKHLENVGYVWTNIHRIITILLWPLAMIIFLASLFIGKR